jgi:hypothetical protein
MLLTSIETTPNPNSMKLNVDESLGKAVTYRREQPADCPEYVARLLKIEGVKSAFVCQNFITLNRDPRADWKLILDAASHVFDGAEPSAAKIDDARQAAEQLGQIAIAVQTFRGIPIQVKVTDRQGEKRLALSSRFNEAAQTVQAQSGADYLKERYWADWGVRYGSLEEVATDVLEEIEGSLDAKEFDRVVKIALGSVETSRSRTRAELRADLASDDWHKRLLAVQELSTADDDAVSWLGQAAKDPNHQVRRLVAAALGASGNKAAVGPLSDLLLNDPSVAVRRTAGDALSDLGDVSAQSSVCRALLDPNKLVRWRAARFLADVGTEESLTFLQAAANDPEFEVRLEIEAAIERISQGKETSMPAWKKILNSVDLPAPD